MGIATHQKLYLALLETAQEEKSRHKIFEALTNGLSQAADQVQDEDTKKSLEFLLIRLMEIGYKFPKSDTEWKANHYSD